MIPTVLELSLAIPDDLAEIILGLLVLCGIILLESLRSGLWFLVRIDWNCLCWKAVVTEYLDETNDGRGILIQANEILLSTFHSTDSEQSCCCSLRW